MAQKKHKECFVNDDSCKEKIIEAHILSRSATMSLLCGPGQGGLSVIKLGTAPQEVGWSKASAYYCFCGIHDREIFRPIENDVDFDTKNDEQVFLHIFRSFAYSYHKKRSELESNDNIFGSFFRAFGVPGMDNSDIDSRINESKQDQMYAFDQIRDRLLDTWKTKKFQQNLKVNIINLGIAFPFASAGALMAEIIDDSKGFNIVNYNPEAPMVAQPGLILTVFPLKNDRTVIILAALSSDPNAVLTFNRFDRVKSDPAKLLRAISGLMLSSNKENTFLHPTLWEYMKTNKLAKQLVDDLKSSRGTDLLNDEPWLPKTNLFDKVFSCQNIGINTNKQNPL